MTRRRARLLAALATVGLAGCAEPELKAAGQPCFGSAECAPGLLCDLGATPPVCAGNLTTDARVIDAGIDAFMPIDAAAVDAAAIDAAVDAAIDAP